MATSAAEDFGQAIGQLLQIIFSPLFPTILITLWGVSYVLSFFVGLPQFALIAYLAHLGVEYAFANLWAGGLLALFVLAAPPLAWIGFREAETRTSRVIGYWVVSALFGAGLIWLAHEWAFDGSGIQMFVFGFLLFGVWVHVCETALITVKLVALSRPQPGREVVEAQKAHGDAALAGEAEAVALLNPER